MKKKSNPFKNIVPGVFSLPQNSKEAFRLGVIFGERFIYEMIKNSNPLDGDQNDVRQATLHLKNILKQKEIAEISKTIKNSNILKLRPDESFELGNLLGKKRAIEFVLKNNFDKKLIRDRWFVVADEIENFE